MSGRRASEYRRKYRNSALRQGLSLSDWLHPITRKTKTARDGAPGKRAFEVKERYDEANIRANLFSS